MVVVVGAHSEIHPTAQKNRDPSIEWGFVSYPGQQDSEFTISINNLSASEVPVGGIPMGVKKREQEQKDRQKERTESVTQRMTEPNDRREGGGGWGGGGNVE